MADDGPAVSTTEKSESSGNVSGRRNSSSGNRGGANSSGGSGTGSRQQKKFHESREDSNSSESTLSSPAKSNRGGTSSNRERRSNNCNREREGRNRKSIGATGKNPQSPSKKSTFTPEAETPTEDASSAGQEQQEASAATSKKNSNNKKQVVKKRAPPKEDYEIKPNDVFINEKSHILAQLSKCKNLFENGHREIFIHGLGKAIPRAINTAFELKDFYHGTVDYSVNTSTVELYDDVLDLQNPDQPPTVRTRNVSSVDIRVFRSIDIP